MPQHTKNTHPSLDASVIHDWLTLRQQVILLFCAIDTQSPFIPKKATLHIRIQAFFQNLMSYCFLGHFDLFEQCQLKQLYQTETIERVDNLIKALQQNSAQCVLLNDKYQTAEDCLKQILHLKKDLSRLGEFLSERFELEDQLTQQYVHQKQVA